MKELENGTEMVNEGTEVITGEGTGTENPEGTAAVVAGPVFVNPGKKGVTNAQMIPAMREALAANDLERLAGLKATHETVYGNSIRYLTKDQKAKLEALTNPAAPAPEATAQESQAEVA